MSRSKSCTLELLEGRTLLSTSSATIHYSDFSSTTHLVGNGFGTDPMTSGNSLRLTSAVQHQARSVWYDTIVPVERFRTDFSFKSTANTNGGDGFTFTLVNGGTNTLGADGRGLGYGNITNNSVAISFNQFNFHDFGSKFGFAINGERPPTNRDMGAIDLHNGHTFKATATYDGQVLNVYITDSADKSKTFAASKTINLATVLGAKRATVGFTAGTGEADVAQDLLSWSYVGSKAPAPAPVPTAPTFTSTAVATPEPVSGTTTHLTALASDTIDAEAKLTYSWSTISKPAGSKAPIFSTNATNAAKSTTATFSKDGTYVFRVTATNSQGLKSTSDVKVRVAQTATTIELSPHEVKVKARRHETFSAVMVDQFGHDLRTQPAFRFSVIDGAGKINAKTGLYTAGDDEGHDVVQAAAMGLAATVGVTIKPHEPSNNHTATP